MLLAFVGPDYGFPAKGLQEAEAHIGHGRFPVQAGFFFHNVHQLVESRLLFRGQVQLFGNQPILFYQLGGGEADGELGPADVRLQEHGGGMDAAVHRAHRVLGIIAFHAEVHPLGLDVPLGYKQGVVDELIDALIFGGGNGDYGNAQNVLQLIDADGAAVGPDLIHHVQRQHHGDLQLHELHGQIQVPLDVGGIHNVDDAAGMVLHQKVPGDNFLVGIGRQGIDARQIRDGGFGMVADGAVFPVHGDPREIAHVLVGTGELVEESGFAAVLVACQGEGQRTLPDDRLLAPALADTGVGDGSDPPLGRMGLLPIDVDILNFNIFSLIQPQRQFIPAQSDLDRVPHGGYFLQYNFRFGRQAHIQQMVPKGPVSAD